MSRPHCPAFHSSFLFLSQEVLRSYQACLLKLVEKNCVGSYLALI